MKEKKEKKQNGYFRHMAEAIKMELREHKSSFMVYLILRILVIVMLVLQVLNQNYENVFLCILTLLLLIVPSFVQVTFKIELPTTLEIIVLFFIFAAEILGEINEFYLLFPFWDTVLHTLNGFLAAAIGFSLVDLLNRSERTVFHLSPALPFCLLNSQPSAEFSKIHAEISACIQIFDHIAEYFFFSFRQMQHTRLFQKRFQKPILTPSRL